MERGERGDLKRVSTESRDWNWGNELERSSSSKKIKDIS